MQTKRVLLVEDDEDYAVYVRRLLSRAGYAAGKIEVAHDETTAHRLLDEAHYDLVVTDLDLSPGNGLRILEHVRRKSPDAHRVVLTSAPEKARQQLPADAILAHGVWDKKWETSTIRRELESLLQPTR